MLKILQKKNKKLNKQLLQKISIYDFYYNIRLWMQLWKCVLRKWQVSFTHIMCFIGFIFYIFTRIVFKQYALLVAYKT